MNINKIIKESLEKVLMEAVQMTPEQQAYVRRVDPTEDKKYGQWIVKNFTELQQVDAATIRAMLADFEEYKKNLPSMGFNSNIQELSVDDLREIHVALNDMRNRNVSVSVYNNLKNFDGQYEVVSRDENCVIVHVFTWDADRFFGSNTTWCTVGDEYYFHSYSKDGYYIILPIENGKVNIKSNKRIQFHAEADLRTDTTRIYAMDVDDSPLSQGDVAQMYPAAASVMESAKEGGVGAIKDARILIHNAINDKLILFMDYFKELITEQLYGVLQYEDSSHQGDAYIRDEIQVEGGWTFELFVDCDTNAYIDIKAPNGKLLCYICGRGLQDEDFMYSYENGYEFDDINEIINDCVSDLRDKVSIEPILGVIKAMNDGVVKFEGVKPQTLSSKPFEILFSFDGVPLKLYASPQSGYFDFTLESAEDSSSQDNILRSVVASYTCERVNDVENALSYIQSSVEMYQRYGGLLRQSQYINKVNPSSLRTSFVGSDDYVEVRITGDSKSYKEIITSKYDRGFRTRNICPCDVLIEIYQADGADLFDIKQQYTRSEHPQLQIPPFEILNYLNSIGLIDSEIKEDDYDFKTCCRIDISLLPKVIDTVIQYISNKYGLTGMSGSLPDIEVSR